MYDDTYYRTRFPEEQHQILREALDGQPEAPYFEAVVAYYAAGETGLPEPRPDAYPGMDIGDAWMAASCAHWIHLFKEFGGPVRDRHFKTYTDRRDALLGRMTGRLIFGRDAR